MQKPLKILNWQHCNAALVLAITNSAPFVSILKRLITRCLVQLSVFNALWLFYSLHLHVSFSLLLFRYESYQRNSNRSIKSNNHEKNKLSTFVFISFLSYSAEEMEKILFFNFLIHFFSLTLFNLARTTKTTATTKAATKLCIESVVHRTPLFIPDSARLHSEMQRPKFKNINYLFYFEIDNYMFNSMNAHQ